MPACEKRGYLLEDLRLFNLRDEAFSQVDFHYHEFHKIIFFRGGSASYSIEGNHYDLERGDIVIVGRGCVHRQEVNPGEPYVRTVIYISPDFLRAHSGDSCDLEMCFCEASRTGCHILRLAGRQLRHITDILKSLEQSCAEDEFGSWLLCRSLALQLVIELGRNSIIRDSAVPGSVRDEKILEILKYISSNLTAEISIDDLAERFYISKYHMMRRFRSETGYTVHSYISSKRLLLAHEMISGGISATDACFACGFRDYSSFSRAYNKLFGIPPSGRNQYTINLLKPEEGK